MQTARRIAPYTRHVKVTRSECRAERRASRDGGGERVTLSVRGKGAATETPACDDGSLHQLLWLRTAAGRELVADFTGPQYGLEARLAATGSPFWWADAADARLRQTHGLQLQGAPLRFEPPRAPWAELAGGAPQSAAMHALVGLWVRDSLLRRLAWAGHLAPADLAGLKERYASLRDADG
jgi:hypothetical protein